jgi:DNA-binding transcriptional LysR family regulator
MMPSFSDIEAVLAVARHGSFRSAAIALGMSRSALSHAIATFEKRLDVRLFHRSTRSVALTEAGRRFVAGVAPAFEEIRACIDDVTTTRHELSGTLRINTFAPAARWLMPSIFLEFMRRYPRVTLDIVTDGRLVDIVKEGFDAGIRLSHAVPLDMVAIDLGYDLTFAVVGSPDYLADHGLPTHPNDLQRHRCIGNRMPSGRKSPWRFWVDDKIIEAIYEGPAIFDDPVLILDAARAGAGLAYIPQREAEPFIADGSLSHVLANWMPASSGISLYYPGRRHTPAALRALSDLIKGQREVAREICTARISGISA